MKISMFFVLAMLLTFNLLAQSNKLKTADTISYSSNIDAVTDTIPNMNLFDEETPMDLTLKYDITSFIRNKVKGEYLDAELVIEYKDYSVTKDIRLKARGNNRRDQCFFPPIYLNFKTDPIKSTELEGIKKIKLVTHCSTSKSYTNYILKEYLVYKLYNILTDYSFRVKMLNMEYIDTGKKERNYKRFGILIEPLDLLTKRSGSIEVESAFVKGTDVFEDEADLVSLFQYMIGNTDWRIKGGHNTKFMKSLAKVTPKVSPVPYDFDYAGFVGTHYSHPQEWTSIESVTQREYMGYCRNTDEEYLNTINKFIDKKDEILQTISSFNYLDERERESLIDYIEDFYDLLEHPKNFIYTLKNECRNIDF
ncbi:MAG: hypothetical protein GQ525_08885 [Draconibacterium sp.]|nr:hypothetical protein [Draconibacterium sp.]